MPIGPTKETKIVKYLSCERCDVLKPIKLGGTARYPKIRINHYCMHPGLPSQVAFIKKYPKTPPWCRELDPAREGDLDEAGNPDTIKIKIWDPKK